MTTKRTILIAGPTASGKSAAAAAIAGKCNGVVVNADSIQVYNELRILSARPTEEEERAHPHRLYGHVPISQHYSVAQWLDDVKRVLDVAKNESRPVIIVGGTGLYFKALTEGLSPIPDIPADMRKKFRDKAKVTSAQDLYQELHELDPMTATQLRNTDPQRITRALEVYAATGRPLAEWQQIPGKPLLSPEAYSAFVVATPRSDLHRAAETRFDRMIEAGALQEAAAINKLAKDQQLDPALPALKALGLGPLRAHLDGDLSLEEAVVVGKRETRHYIKRQETWLARHNHSFEWVPLEEMKRDVIQLFAFIDP